MEALTKDGLLRAIAHIQGLDTARLGRGVTDAQAAAIEAHTRRHARWWDEPQQEPARAAMTAVGVRVALDREQWRVWVRDRAICMTPAELALRSAFEAK